MEEAAWPQVWALPALGSALTARGCVDAQVQGLLSQSLGEGLRMFSPFPGNCIGHSGNLACFYLLYGKY